MGPCQETTLNRKSCTPIAIATSPPFGISGAITLTILVLLISVVVVGTTASKQRTVEGFETLTGTSLGKSCEAGLTEPCQVEHIRKGIGIRHPV